MTHRTVPATTSRTPSVEYAAGAEAALDTGVGVGPGSVVTAPTVPSAFASFRVRNFRLFFGGQVLSLIGSTAAVTAQDLLVLQLGGRGPELGLVTAAQLTPMLVLGLFTGVVIDRLDKRTLLVAAQAGLMLSSLGLAVVDLAGAATVAVVTLFSLLSGLFLALEIPTRQSFWGELVGPELMPNAIGLNSVSFQGSRLVGPAVAGLAVGLVGTGLVLLANAVSFLAVIGGIVAMRPAELVRRPPVARAKGQLREGYRYVRTHEAVRTPMVLAGVVGAVGINFQVTLPLMSVELDAGSAGYGLLVGAQALGALLAALVAARRKAPSRRTLLVSVALFGGFEALGGLASSAWVLGLLLVPTGYALLTATTTANVSVQLATDPLVRGRVVSLYVLVFLAGTPIGSPLVGYLCHAAGVRAAVMVTGAFVALSAAAVALATRPRA